MAARYSTGFVKLTGPVDITGAGYPVVVPGGGYWVWYWVVVVVPGHGGTGTWSGMVVVYPACTYTLTLGPWSPCRAPLSDPLKGGPVTAPLVSFPPGTQSQTPVGRLCMCVHLRRVGDDFGLPR